MVEVSSVLTLGPQSNVWPVNLLPRTTPTYLHGGHASYIEDVDGNFGVDNPCFHVTSDSRFTGADVLVQVDKTIPTVGNVFVCALTGPGGYTTIDNAWESIGIPKLAPGSDLDPPRPNIPDYAWEGWMSVYPVIREELKLLNSVYELKDFSRLPGLFAKTRKGFTDLSELIKGRRWAHASKLQGELRLMYQVLQPQSPATWSYLLKLPRKVATKLSLRDVLQRLVSLGRLSADHLLNWQFCIAPGLRDMAAASSAAGSVASQLDGLLSRADGTVQKSHWSRTVPHSNIEGWQFVDRDSKSWEGPSTLVYTKPWCNISELPKYTFTARYAYTYSPETVRLAEQLAMKDALGLNLSAANIWQAIPWSFVVDWFIRIGDTLQTLTPHHLEPIVEFYGACHSLKYALHAGFDIKSGYQSGEGYPALGYDVGITIATRDDKYYVRENVIPFVSLPKTSDFSSLEKLLALALGLSSVRYTS